MKLIVINNRPATGEKIPCPDGTTTAPGERHEMTGRSKDEALAMMAYNAEANVIILAELDASDRAVIVCDMKQPANPGSGVSTLAGVGFDLEDQAGAAANADPPMYMGVFDDADCQIPAVTATLDTATAGTIDAGGGTNLLEVTPTAAGEFACTLTDLADETVYIKAWPMGTAYLVDSTETDDVTFIP